MNTEGFQCALTPHCSVRWRDPDIDMNLNMASVHPGVWGGSQSHVPMWKQRNPNAKSINDGEQPLVSAAEDIGE